MVVDVGAFLGMGGKDVAVHLSDIKTDNNRLTLDMTKEQLQQAQAYQLENPDTGAGSSTSPVSWRPAGLGRRLQYGAASVAPAIGRAGRLLRPAASCLQAIAPPYRQANSRLRA